MSIIDAIAGHPAVFNLIQDLAGRAAILKRMQPWLDQLTGRVLDVGGGTGRLRERLRPDVRYVCVDLEGAKLRYGRGAVEGDAAALPFADGAVDGALFFGVLHHLADGVLDQVVAEASRVLASGGRLVMIDPIAVPAPKATARALWSLDRGNHPRTREVIDATLRSHFHVSEVQAFDVLHHYFAMNCTKP